MLALKGLSEAKAAHVKDGARISELANTACFLYIKQDPKEKTRLLGIVLSNRRTNPVSLYPTYRKPFELI